MQTKTREARRLTAEVANPDGGDRRVKNDWRKFPKWKPGFTFYVGEESLDFDLPVEGVDPKKLVVKTIDNGYWSHQRITDKKLVEKFLANSVPLTTEERTFNVRLREIEGQGSSCTERIILKGLLKLGRVSLDELPALFDTGLREE